MCVLKLFFFVCVILSLSNFVSFFCVLLRLSKLVYNPFWVRILAEKKVSPFRSKRHLCDTSVTLIYIKCHLFLCSNNWKFDFFPEKVTLLRVFVHPLSPKRNSNILKEKKHHIVERKANGLRVIPITTIRDSDDT